MKSKGKRQIAKGKSEALVSTNGLFVVALALTVLCFISGCRSAETKEQQAKPVKVKAAERQTSNRAARYAASIMPNTQVEIAFKVGGYVETIAQVRDQSGSGDTFKRATSL